MPYVTLSDKDDLAKSYDFIIVGAGSAGCPLASRLSEDRSVTVLLIEAGSRDHTLEETINGAVPAAAAKLQHTTMDWEYYTEPQAPRACTHLNTFRGAIESRKHRSFWPRGKGMGGSSLINYMAWVRGHPNDYNEWETDYGCKGWGWASLKPIFEERIENIAECDESRLCPKCRLGSKSRGPYGISHKTPACSLASQFLEACNEVGFEIGDYNCGCNKAAKGVVGLHQQSVKQGTRCTAARAYIDPLMMAGNERPNLTVLSGARCTRLLTETNEGKVVATGVQLVPDSSTSDASTLDVKCGKEVILSAGALGSPQILLQSGIGPNGSTLDSPNVGQNLLDHLVSILRFPPKLGQGNQDIGTINGYKAEGWKTALGHLWDCFINHQGMLSSSSYDASLFFSSNPVQGLTGLMKVRPNLQISAMCSTTDKDFMEGCFGLDFDAFELSDAEYALDAEGLMFCCTLLHPHSKGTITVNDKNDLVIQPNYLSDPEDVKQLIAALRKGLEIGNTSVYDPIVRGAPLWPKDLCRKYKLPCHDEDGVPKVEDYPDEFLEEYVRRYATTLYHPTSTCRMGTIAANAVVDPTLKVFGVENLRVADASIQPTIVSANTQASCVVIGEKAADIIREEYKLKSNPQELLDAVGSYECEVLRKRKVIAGVLLATLTATVMGVSVLVMRGRLRSM